MQRDGTKEIENFYGAVAPIIHKGNEQEFWRPTRIPRPAIVFQSLKDNQITGEGMNWIVWREGAQMRGPKFETSHLPKKYQITKNKKSNEL